jgi:aspartyl protease family protein
MGRIYLFLVAALGLFGWLASNLPSSRAPVDQASVPTTLTFAPTATQPQFSNQDGSLELQRQPDGHFYADVRVNGTLIHMLVDTGASAIALSREDAQSAGLATSIGMNDVIGEGADGAIHGEYARLDRVELGPLSAERLDAVILSNGQQSLLGQSFLGKFASVQIEGDRMVLR